MIKFESFSSRSLSFNDSLSVVLILDVDCLTDFFNEGPCNFRNWLFGGNDNSNNTTTDFSLLESFEQFLHSEDLDAVILFHIVELQMFII